MPLSQRVIDYRKNHGIENKQGIAVIIQQMVDANASGVGYGIHPTNGNRNVKMISAVYGLGRRDCVGRLECG